MTTLYDLLGARPDDDKEDLRKAFHAAVKATHPDVHPDDPGASVRFRQIVRAHAVLSDAELKAAYDKMLSSEGDAPRRGIVSMTMAKIVPDAIAITVLAIMLLGGYALFVHVSKASVAAIRPVDVDARAPVVAAVVTPPTQSSPVARPEPRDAPARAEPGHERLAPDAVSTVATARGGETTAGYGPATDSTPRDARYYREEGLRAYQAGDFDLALVDFDLAIQLDPGLEAAYIDRSIVFYRLGEIGRAFADLDQAKRIAAANRAKAQLQRNSRSSSR